jgi:hypothetical protein
MRWFIHFTTLNLALFVAVLFTVWLVGGFGEDGFGGEGTTVIVLGIVVTMAVATGLMGLIFYSNRADVDERVYRATDERKRDE